MRRIAVIGLGYVGLAVARAFARRFPGTLGFDRDAERVAGLARGVDPTGALAETGALGALALTSDARALAGCDFFVIAVPTPIDAAKRPELAPLEEAAATVGRALRPGAVVVLESTVYPGLTEGWLGPRLERASGLVRGRDFTLGYSPERIDPGAPEHALERVTKVIAAEDERTLDVLAECYGAIVEAGLHRAPSIAVAEAAKVLENVQRDLNVALVNELARICHALGLDTRAVLATAGTKWNFVPFTPGLVGGHCIGVDPFWLAARAESVGTDAALSVSRTARRSCSVLKNSSSGRLLTVILPVPWRTRTRATDDLRRPVPIASPVRLSFLTATIIRCLVLSMSEFV
jgi:UDP-N-acetyl-D-galactosamine dehydrogenase